MPMAGLPSACSRCCNAQRPRADPSIWTVEAAGADGARRPIEARPGSLSREALLTREVACLSETSLGGGATLRYASPVDDGTRT